MVKLKRKLFVLLLILISSFLLGAGKYPSAHIVDEEIHQKSRFQFVSVSPYDEIALGFSNGVVNIYDIDGNFLYSYQFPVIDPIFSLAFDGNEERTMKYHLRRSGILLTYNRKGELLAEDDVSERGSSEEVITINSRDSQGSEYKTKGNKVWKIYSNGEKEVFYELYAPGEDIAAGVILVPIVIFYMGKQGMKLFASLQKPQN